MSKKNKKKQNIGRKIFAYIMLLLAVGLAVTSILPYVLK